MNTILKKSWGMLWQYRALWLFGAVFALVSVNIFYPIAWLGEEENRPWTRIQITETMNVKIPGFDVTIDLTAPEGVRIITPYTVGWPSFSELANELNREVSLNPWPLLIELLVILVSCILLGILLRYVVETALIRMVDETNQTGKQLSLREGLRRGWSRRAWRLFLLDFCIGLLAAIGTIVVFGLAAAPILLAIGSHASILIAVGIGTFGLLALAGAFWLAVAFVLSFVLQPIRRACVLEDQSLWASIRQGVRLTRRHFKDFGLLWLTWMGIRVLWSLAGTVVVILLAPVLFVTFLLAVVLGGIPTVVIAMVAHVFMGGVTPWVMGTLVGLPIFILVMISPVLFVSGLVEIFKSCIWTLAYRDLKALEQVGAVRTSSEPMTLAPRTAS
jgi:hypothetical protein